MNNSFEILGLTMPELGGAFWLNVAPFIILALGALITLVQCGIRRFSHPEAVRNMTILILAATSAWWVYALAMPEEVLIGGSIVADHFGRVCALMITLISLVTVLIASKHHTSANFFRGEVASIFLVVTMGGLAMVTSGDLIAFFIGLEMSSIGLYGLIGYVKPTRQSQEGAIKYLVLGSFASGFLLFGFALLYAGGGSLQFADMLAEAQMHAHHKWVGLGVLFSVAGLSFKLALVPFHLWAPDAYEAAPTPLTAMMATAVKVTILAIIMRLFAWGQAPLSEVWLPALMVLAMLSMVVANVMALVQTSVKRMLAYSSVAHSGYMAVALCGVAAMTGELPYMAVLFYVVSYSLMSLGAFAVLGWLENEHADNLQLDDFSGLAKSHPWAAFAMAAFMFSFAGLPPTAGFIGKFLVFNAALQAQLYFLVVVGVIGSAIALYYYLRLVVRMYMEEPVESRMAGIVPTPSRLIAGVAAVTLVLTLAFGTVAPNILIKSTLPAATSLAD